MPSKTTRKKRGLEDASKENQGIWSYLLILGTLIVIATSGYFIFRTYSMVLAPNITNYSLLLIAIVAGVAVYFSPCTFAVLPSYLVYYYNVTEKTKDSKKLKVIFSNGLVAATGIFSFNILLGSLIGVLGAGFGKSLNVSGGTLNIYVTVVRAIVGLILIVLGYLHFSGRGFHFRILNRINQLDFSKQKNTYKGLFTFGFTYTAIGVGCGGPILAGLSLFAFTTGGFYTAFYAFLIYSLTMGLLMISISLLVGLSREKLLSKLSASTITIKKLSGLILIIVGLLLLPLPAF